MTSDATDSDAAGIDSDSGERGVTKYDSNFGRVSVRFVSERPQCGHCGEREMARAVDQATARVPLRSQPARCLSCPEQGHGPSPSPSAGTRVPSPGCPASPASGRLHYQPDPRPGRAPSTSPPGPPEADPDPGPRLRHRGLRAPAHKYRSSTSVSIHNCSYLRKLPCGARGWSCKQCRLRPWWRLAAPSGAPHHLCGELAACSAGIAISQED